MHVPNWLRNLGQYLLSSIHIEIIEGFSGVNPKRAKMEYLDISIELILSVTDQHQVNSLIEKKVSISKVPLSLNLENSMIFLLYFDHESQFYD